MRGYYTPKASPIRGGVCPKQLQITKERLYLQAVIMYKHKNETKTLY
jgi:hypothetical protein